MASVLGSLTVDLVANTGKFQSGMSDAARAAMRTSKQIHEGFSRLGDVAQSALAPLGNLGQTISATLGEIGQAASGAMAKFREMSGATQIVAGVGAGVAVAAGAIGAGLFEAANKAAEFGSKIYEASEKTGMSASNLSGLAAVSKATGENFDSLTESLARAGRNLQAAIITPGGTSAKVLAGVMGGAKDLAALGMIPLDDAMQKVLARIFALNNTGERNLALQALLGRGWQSNVETLKLLAEQGYGPAIARAKEFGMFFDEDHARQAKEYTVEVQQLKGELSGLGLTLGQAVMPAISGFIAVLANMGKAVRGLAADFGVLTSVASGPGAFFAALEKDKAAWADFNKGIAEFKNSVKELVDGSKAAADANKALAPTVEHVGKAHHEAAPKVLELGAAFKAIIPAVQTVNASLKEIADSSENVSLPDFTKQIAGMQLDFGSGLAHNMQEATNAAEPPLHTFHDDVVAMFQDLQKQGDEFGKHVFDSFGHAINDMTDQLARFIVTGKANFAELFRSLQEQIIRTGLHKAISQLAGLIFPQQQQNQNQQQQQTQSTGATGFFGRLFGGGRALGAGGQRGDSEGNPLFVKDVGSGGPGGGLFGGAKSSSDSDDDSDGGDGGDGDGGDGGDGDGGLSGAFSSFAKDIGSLFAKLASVMKSAFSGIGSLFSGLFGGGRQLGGPVFPGKAYLVGEHHPEFFIPRTAGHIAPALPLASGSGQPIHLHFHGVTDFDSFRRSQGQIMATVMNQLAIAHARNR